MRRVMGLAGAALIALAVAAPVAASAPEREVISFTTEPYIFAECDGYEVIEQLNIHSVIDRYFNAAGEVTRQVNHSSTTGVDWRSDTGDQLATFSDAGGTFTATADNTFTWTGNHGAWTLTDGTTVKLVGRVVVEEVEPGVFERTFGAGSFDDVDPCTW
jgi:hypothetical protein